MSKACWPLILAYDLCKIKAQSLPRIQNVSKVFAAHYHHFMQLENIPENPFTNV